MMVGRNCKDCHELKPLAEFRQYKSGAGNTLFRRECKRCASNATLAKHRARPDLRTIAARHRISEERYQQMIAKGCEVCGSFKMLRIDHDHNCCASQFSCGKCVRGVLCHLCNASEGMLNGDSDRMFNLSVYMLKNVDVLGGLHA